MRGAHFVPSEALGVVAATEEDAVLAKRTLRDVAAAAGFVGHNRIEKYLDALEREGPAILRRFNLPVPDETTTP